MKKAKPTLLEQVKSVPILKRGRPRRTKPDVDTALAWLREEITNTQIAKTIWPDNRPSSVSSMLYLFLNMSLREAYEQGKIKIVG